MFHYLAPYVGAGTDDDPFRPRGSEQPGWSAIDLRADSTVLAGRALMAVPLRDDTIGTYLGDAPDEVSAAIKSAVETRFGITLAATRLRQILPELLITHARNDGSRWRPLRAMHDGLLRIYIAGLWWEARSLSGGSTITESFNTANSDTLGPDLSWTELTADHDVVSNTCESQTAPLAVSGVARADSDLATANHYAQFSLVAADTSLTVGHNTGNGPICRKDSTSTLTFYHGRLASANPATKATQLSKFSGGTATQLGSGVAWTPSLPDVIRVQASGSTISALLEGISQIVATDTAITGNLRTGIRTFDGALVSPKSGLDAFAAGDLDIAGGGAHGAMYPRMQRHIHQSWTVPR